MVASSKLSVINSVSPQVLHSCNSNLINNHLRRTREGNVFTTFCLLGVPI